jgi:hypothetical protein
MEIIVLGFGTCRLEFPPTLGEPKAMISKFTMAYSCFGQNAMKPTYIAVYQEYFKVPMDKYLSVFLHSAPGTCKAGYRIEIHAAKSMHERIGSQYKSSS